MNFKTIRTKMILGFTLVLLLIAAMIIYNFTVLNNVNQTTEDVLEEDLPLLIADEQLLSDIYNQAGLARGYILNGDSKYKDLFHEARESSIENQKKIQALSTSSGIEELLQDTAEWQEVIQAFASLEKAEHEISDLIGRYEDYINNRENQIIDLEEDILANGKRTMIVVGVISIFVILISMAIAIISANSISKPLRAVTDR